MATDKVIITIQSTDPGSYSKDVMDQMAGSIQKYLLEEESMKPERVFVIFSADYLSRAVFVPTKPKSVDAPEVPEHLEPQHKILITANIPLGMLRAPVIFKNHLASLFTHKGQLTLTDKFETICF